MTILPVLNVDLLRSPDPREVRDAGAAAIRFPLWGRLDSGDAIPFASFGLGRWGVVIPSSVADWDSEVRVNGFCALWASYLTHVGIWNEPDGRGEASSTLDPVECQRRALLLCKGFRRYNPAIRLIAPAIVREPEYLNALDLRPYDALDAHLYGLAADIPYYLPRFPGRLPIYVGETFCDPMLPSGKFPLQWQKMMADQRVFAIAPFWHDPPDAPGLGIQGRPDKLATFRALADRYAREVQTVATVSNEEIWATRWQTYRRQATYRHEFGLPTAWRKNADAWGVPLWDDERAVKDGAAVRQGMLFHRVGLVVWDGSAAKVVGWPAA